MGIAILFRESHSTSPFNTAVNKLVSLKGEELIICTGTATHTPLQDPDLINNIKLGFLGFSAPQITTMAGKFNGGCAHGSYNCKSKGRCFPCQYNEFVKQLKLTKSFIVDARRDTSDSWHAKIMMKIHNRQPIAMLIGSSNFTGSTYWYPGVSWHSSPILTPNYECDVLIWNDLGAAVFSEEEYRSEEIILTQTSNQNEDILLKERLDRIRSHINDQQKTIKM